MIRRCDRRYSSAEGQTGSFKSAALGRAYPGCREAGNDAVGKHEGERYG